MDFVGVFDLKIIYIEVRSFALASRNIIKISHQPEIIIFGAKGVCHYGTVGSLGCPTAHSLRLQVGKAVQSTVPT
jgi:hypothetical protein